MNDKFGEYQRIRLAMLKADLIDTLAVRINIQRIRSDLAAGLNIRVYGCPPECKSPMVPTNCTCVKTCDKTECPTGSACLPGCTCPEGMVMNGGKCIARTECPCYYSVQSRVLKIGEKIPSAKNCTDVLCTASGLVREVNTERDGCHNCTGGMEWTPCKDCHKTCKHRKMSAACLATCKPGCACPKGTYMDEASGKCVPSCPCEMEGVKYPVGKKWTDKCRSCECTMEKGAVCKESGCHLSTCPSGYVMKNDDPADGKCCECVPIKYCEYKGVKHPLDTVWSDGPCKSLECRRTSSGETRLVEKITECPAKCANGMAPVVKGNKCCYCEPVTTTTAPTTTTTAIVTTTAPVCTLHLCDCHAAPSP
ncbi:hypothetical protein BOX15_Mlig007621g1 [Macrostomum lignano]|uniref:VWFC domain-containing protein n=1 Tax=Macrostomum lignano TaxID=282301 RepID=A0A267EXG4_9PLAT|nr:hypothetical protein BOX15_Mlig007621g1 [Macrostomum lignano]